MKTKVSSLVAALTITFMATQSPFTLGAEANADQRADPQRIFETGLQWDYQNPSSSRDFVKAIECYRQAAELGHVEARGLLSLLELWGDRGWNQRADEANVATTLGKPTSGFVEYCRGYNSEHGVGTDVDLDTAKRHYAASVRPLKLLAEKDNAYAQLLLAYVYKSGVEDVQDDDERIVQLVRAAADQGLPHAQAQLGQAYLSEAGVQKDEDKSYALATQAAAQGCAFGEFLLGVMYEEGSGVLSVDPQKAIEMFRRAADRSYPAAQYNLAVAHRDGTSGVSENAPEAARLFRLASNSGDADARNNLGLMYKLGHGGLPQNDAKAVHLFRQVVSVGRGPRIGHGPIQLRDPVLPWRRRTPPGFLASGQPVSKGSRPGLRQRTV